MSKVDVDYINRCLKITDWKNYEQRVVSQVAKKAEDYRLARARALEDIRGESVFV